MIAQIWAVDVHFHDKWRCHVRGFEVLPVARLLDAHRSIGRSLRGEDWAQLVVTVASYNQRSRPFLQ